MRAEDAFSAAATKMDALRCQKIDDLLVVIVAIHII